MGGARARSAARSRASALSGMCGRVCAVGMLHTYPPRTAIRALRARASSRTADLSASVVGTRTSRYGRLRMRWCRRHRTPRSGQSVVPANSVPETHVLVLGELGSASDRSAD